MSRDERAESWAALVTAVKAKIEGWGDWEDVERALERRDEFHRHSIASEPIELLRHFLYGELTPERVQRAREIVGALGDD